jgi:hypothetical protein
MTKKQLIQENKLANAFRKEAISNGIRSPAKQLLYINSRLKGKSVRVSYKSASD